MNLRGHLSDAFLGRAKRAYRFAVEGSSGPSVSLWGQINELPNPVHAALPSERQLRSIVDPVESDLFYGVDNLACSIAEQWKSNAAQYAALSSRADIARLAEALGVRRINVDSITEMERGSALTFLRWVDSHCDMFLSINHEANSGSRRADGARHFSAILSSS
jgi:hypothetical protein